MTMMMVIGMIDNDSGGFSIVVQCKAVAISHVYITFQKYQQYTILYHCIV